MTIAKRILGLLLVASLPIFAGSAVMPSRAHAQSAEAATESRAEGDVAGISYFYDALTDDGGWVEHPRFGQVWQPDVDDDWRPYTLGRWAYSDTYGWTWLSDEPFGWAVYHYGRWTRDADFGWMWVPGSEWAPAWVLWRYNDEAVGWAPMPPETRFERGRVFADPGFYESRRFLPRWVFASPRSFTRPGLDRYVRPVSWNRDLIGRTRSRLSYDFAGNRVVNRGIPVEDLEKMLRGPVPRARISAVDKDEARTRPFSKLGDKSDLGDVEVYRPEHARTEGIVRNNPSPRAAGKAKHRGEFGRLPPQRRERFERDDRQLTDDNRRTRRPDESQRDVTSREDDREPRANDRAGDGAYRPWRDPDGRNPDRRRDEAERRLERNGERGGERGGDIRKSVRRDGDPASEAPVDEPPRKGDASLPVDDAPPAKASKRDAGLAPATMPEPELIDPAPGKKSGKPVEYYEEVPADTTGAPSAGDASRDALPTEGTSDRPSGRANDRVRSDRPGRFGNASPSPQPERSTAAQPAVAEPDDDPVSAMDAPVKRKAPTGAADDGPAEAAKAKSASRKPLAKDPEMVPSKSQSAPVEKTKAAKTEAKDPQAETAATGSTPPRKPQPAEAATSGEAGDAAATAKAKRRWDQNGASGSGYPSVVGPDGKEAN